MIPKFKVLETSRLIIRPLSQTDNIEDYLNWMQDKSNFFICSIDPNYTKANLYNFICTKNSDPNALLLGIFDKITGKHIGNGKFEPINFDEKYAVFGVLIGDVNFRGKSILGEFIHACLHEILIPMNITRLVLGVNKLNRIAIRAYTKAGFIPSARPILKLDSMLLELNLIV
jgi:ribosomal-protein-alanine N-acetyltransferase